MINFELHGLMDCAVELAEHFRPLLSRRLDVDTAVEKLMRRPPYARNTADVTECLRMIGELRTLVYQHEGVAEADRMHVAERDAALAQRDAAVARIFELQGQLEQFQQSHADAMAEASRVRAAEREAAIVRIRELEAQFEAQHEAHIARFSIPRAIRRVARLLPGGRRIVDEWRRIVGE
jgi:hypothetical protein